MIETEKLVLRPFAEEDFEEAILQVWEAIKKYNPETVGYCGMIRTPVFSWNPEGKEGTSNCLL